MPTKAEYTVLRDTREQTPWDFPARKPCLGTEVATLKTGDYTLKGYENLFVVERKGSVAEIAQNIVQERFEAELERLREFRHAFLVGEFTWADVEAFPNNSGIPYSKRRFLRVKGPFLLKRLVEIQLNYGVQVVLAGPSARAYVSSLFKRIVEHVRPEPA